jgi:hypothetical protein
METIPEDGPAVGGWGEEQVWEPPKTASRKDSSSHRSRQSAAPEPVAPSHRSSRHSSQKSHRSKPTEFAHPSPPKGSLVSYHVPTVQDVQDISGDWGGDGGWNQQSANKSRSHKSSSSHRTKTSSEEAKAAADPPPSHRSHHSRASKAEPRSYRSKSTEKISEWIEDVPPPSPKALSQGLSHKSSHKSSRRSYVAAEEIGWENGEVPPDGSVGTGYGKKQGSAGAGADLWDKRTSSGSSTRKKQVSGNAGSGAGVDAWDKHTSSGSSTKANLGVRQVSVRSHVSSRRSWGAPPASEAGGGGW